MIGFLTEESCRISKSSILWILFTETATNPCFGNKEYMGRKKTKNSTPTKLAFETVTHWYFVSSVDIIRTSNKWRQMK